MIDFKKIITLTDRGNMPCAPLTLAKAVYLTNGETVENSINAALPKATYETYNNLSTVESWTGKYWTELDTGIKRKVYQKIIYFHISVVGVIQNVNHGVINMGKLRLFKLGALMDINGTGTYRMAIPRISPSYSVSNIGIGGITDTIIQIDIGSAIEQVDKDVMIAIEYTCTDR